MAASHGVTTKPSSWRRSAGLAYGNFGADVLRRIAALVPEFTISGPQAQALGHQADLVVVALWRPDFILAVELQRRLWSGGAAVLPVIFDGRSILVGPVVRPESSPCLGCLGLRVRQHARSEDEERILDTIGSDAGFGIRGHLEHHVSAAAALAVGIMQDGFPAQHVTGISVEELMISQHCLAAVDACPACPRQDRAPLVTGAII